MHSNIFKHCKVVRRGIRSREKREYDPVSIAILKVLGWIGSFATVILSIITSQWENMIYLRTPLVGIGFLGLVFIPIRKPLAIIRNKGKPDTEDNQNFKILILDLDGVIRHIDLETAERAAQSIGFTYTELMKTIWYNEYSYEILCGRSSREEWWGYVQKFDPRLEEVTQDVIWNEVFEISTYDADLIEFVREIKDRFKVVILTNCDKDSKIQILDELGDDHPFDHVLSSSDFGIAKPDPEIFTRLLDRIGVNAEQCVFFDDALANTEGAIHVGMRGYVYQDLNHLQEIVDSPVA